MAQYERDVVALEAAPGDVPLVSRMFRVVHTIKGTSGFLNLARIGALAHAGESLLSRVRDRQVTVTPGLAGALLELGDALRRMLTVLDEAGAEGGDGQEPLADRLKLLAAGGGAAPGSPAPVDGADAVSRSPDEAAGADDSVRVGVELLDKLMNLSDELVLVRNRIDAAAGRGAWTGDADIVRHLNIVTADLQSEVMRLRMQRLSTLWSRMPRVVRDMALACGKRVSLDLDGGEIELDRAILEAIRGPLVHLLRNAVDHGLEAPAARTAAGKPAEGRLSLRAAYEGGRVRIELTDDGAGIDTEAVRRSAVAKGLVTAEAAARMTGGELMPMIFRPGFSTSSSVTALSGRGVGLDVVKTNVERIGGSVDVISTPGAGTIFAIMLPLTLAVVPAIMVTEGEGLFAIPMSGVLELLRREAFSTVEVVQAAPFIRWRGDLLPVVSLGGLLAGRMSGGRTPAGLEGGGLVIIQAGIRRFALAVGGKIDAQDIIVKPRPKHLGPVTVYAGSTVSTEGRVAMILDVAEVARQARVGAARRIEDGARSGSHGMGGRTLLLFRGPDDSRLVMPLDLVGRVERMWPEAVERSGSLEVAQLRGRVVPLIRVADNVAERRHQSRRLDAAPAHEDVIVVVLERAGRQVGIIVDRVTDIIHEALRIDRPAGRDGVLGSAIVGGEIVEVFDVEGVIRRRDPMFFEDAPLPGEQKPANEMVPAAAVPARTTRTGSWAPADGALA